MGFTRLISPPVPISSKTGWCIKYYFSEFPLFCKINNYDRGQLSPQDGSLGRVLGLFLRHTAPSLLVISCSYANCLNASISSMLEMANSWTVTICFGSRGIAIMCSILKWSKKLLLPLNFEWTLSKDSCNASAPLNWYEHKAHKEYYQPATWRRRYC